MHDMSEACSNSRSYCAGMLCVPELEGYAGGALRLDRTHHAATVFEAAGCGAAWATKLGEQAIANDPQVAVRTSRNPFFALPYCGDQAAISEAIAEWADGDALAAHYGHGHDVFCTLDRGRAGTQSVLHSSRRVWLESEFGIAILTPVELAERFRL